MSTQHVNVRWLPVFAALLFCVSPNLFAQAAGGVPRINGYAVDNCLYSGTSCGKPAADAYCQKIGAGTAISFKMARMRPTLILGQNVVCNGDYCFGFTEVNCSASGGTSLANVPRISGYAIDNCLHWGTNCGKPAADAYCQRVGGGTASSYAMARMSPTIVLGDNRICNGETCVGFSVIQCSATAQNSPYIGCFADQENRDMQSTDISYKGNMTIEACLAYCGQRGFSFAGVQYGDYCFCGNTYGKYGPAASGACNMPCAGNKQETCGGPWANGVYRTR